MQLAHCDDSNIAVITQMRRCGFIGTGTLQRPAQCSAQQPSSLGSGMQGLGTDELRAGCGGAVFVRWQGEHMRCPGTASTDAIKLVMCC